MTKQLIIGYFSIFYKIVVFVKYITVEIAKVGKNKCQKPKNYITIHRENLFQRKHQWVKYAYIITAVLLIILY